MFVCFLAGSGGQNGHDTTTVITSITEGNPTSTDNWHIKSKRRKYCDLSKCHESQSSPSISSYNTQGTNLTAQYYLCINEPLSWTINGHNTTIHVEHGFSQRERISFSSIDEGAFVVFW